jgi:L-aspartate semialdehyde sulfurtransferase ferredoxin
MTIEIKKERTMTEQRAILNFPNSLVGKPIISAVVRKYDIEVNIIEAHITPEDDGYMFALVSGHSRAVESAFDYLRKKEITVRLLSRNLIWDETKCVNCTACIGQCSVGAFELDDESFRIEHVASRCIGCKLCIPACSYGALTAATNRLAENRRAQ